MSSSEGETDGQTDTTSCSTACFMPYVLRTHKSSTFNAL